jgi:hypothetical protein
MISIHSTLTLSTPWPVEKQISILYMHNVFKIFQKEVVATRDQCFVVHIVQQEGVKIAIIWAREGKDGSLERIK